MNYQPDQQDQVLNDAEALDGPAFVELVTHTATAEVDESHPWDRQGEEPAGRREAWLAAAERLVAERRAELFGSAG